ncbi:8-oxo-dGTP diphosphatase [Haloferula sargassicola]|uniref:Oxidized purine nucleoside triphosphate hydrolase n=1 Tax=Haloferula sargassicola TaxID=490096 RepID=A0ABP9UWQ0_9BACT
MIRPSPIDWSTWSAPVHATLMFVVREGRILLIEKKRGLGAGKINGPGGKIDPGETPRECAMRETEEELLIRVKDPVKLGELHFAMSDVPDILCHVYRAGDFDGVPTETDEAVPLWFATADIPYHRMWSDDRYWLPVMLEGRTFLGRFAFTGDDVSWNQLVTDVEWPEGE